MGSFDGTLSSDGRMRNEPEVGDESGPKISGRGLRWYWPIPITSKGKVTGQKWLSTRYFWARAPAKTSMARPGRWRIGVSGSLKRPETSCWMHTFSRDVNYANVPA